MQRVPLGVMILALLLFLNGIFNIVVGFFIFIGSPFLMMVGHLAAPITGLIGIVWGVVGMAVAYGLMGLSSWAWTLTVVYLLLGMVVGVANGVAPTCVNVVLLVYLILVGKHFTQ